MGYIYLNINKKTLPYFQYKKLCDSKTSIEQNDNSKKSPMRANVEISSNQKKIEIKNVPSKEDKEETASLLNLFTEAEDVR